MFGLLVGNASLAAESAPHPDLVGLLACKKSIADWGQLVTAASEPATVKKWGWREKAVGSGQLKLFELRKPIVLWGEKTSKIAISGSGVVALLKKHTVEQLVDELHLQPVWLGPNTRIFGKTVTSTSERSGDTSIASKISLSVSTSPEFPGLVLAGCSYSVEVQ
jgi:hypothetical protein